MKNHELKKILLDASRILLDQKLVSTPFQIAISEYNPKEKWGKYLVFCIDVSPLIEYCHIMLSDLKYDKAIGEYKKVLIGLSREYNQSSNDHLKLKHYKNAIVRNSYEVLRSINFYAPLVLSEFYDICRKEMISQQNVVLHLNNIYLDQDRPLNWKLGCFLERKLFSTAEFNNFSSTFFVVIENANDQNDNTIIYSISVFNRENDDEKIRNGQSEIARLIDENDKVVLLEDVLDKIPDSESSESITIPPPADVNE